MDHLKKAHIFKPVTKTDLSNKELSKDVHAKFKRHKIKDLQARLKPLPNELDTPPLDINFMECPICNDAFKYRKALVVQMKECVLVKNWGINRILQDTKKVVQRGKMPNIVSIARKPLLGHTLLRKHKETCIWKGWSKKS